ncbi:MAG: hypothetical protein JWR09_205 [Mucilaginibacter sp.]|nr:hypothetical protein [Mucilaginibacter sp.]
MKKFMKIQLAITIAFALCFTSCSKKNDAAPQQPNTKTLLTAKTWLVIKSASDDNGNGRFDDEYYPIPANTSYFYTIMANGTASENYISGNSNTSVTYSWELSDPQMVKVHNETLHITEYWHIKTLTADQFNFEAYREDNRALYFADQCVPK